MRSLVSIHAPAGGATIEVTVVELDGKVSIHAPAGGATSVTFNSSVSNHVSIHAPAGGATFARLPSVESILFQSTRLREARP